MLTNLLEILYTVVNHGLTYINKNVTIKELEYLIHYENIIC